MWDHFTPYFTFWLVFLKHRATQSLPLRAKLAMASAPASCSWWLWDGTQDRTLWKTLPFPPSNSFCMDSSTQRQETRIKEAGKEQLSALSYCLVANAWQDCSESRDHAWSSRDVMTKLNESGDSSEASSISSIWTGISGFLPAFALLVTHVSRLQH